MIVHFNAPQKTDTSSPSGEEKRSPFSLLFNAANLIRAASLLIGAGFFSTILLLGTSLALRFPTLSGACMVMGFTLLMSTLIAGLTHYIIGQAYVFKERIFGRTLSSLSTAELLALHAQMHKLLEILLTLQQELQAKEQNTTTPPHRSKDQMVQQNINGNVLYLFREKTHETTWV